MAEQPKKDEKPVRITTNMLDSRPSAGQKLPLMILLSCVGGAVIGLIGGVLFGSTHFDENAGLRWGVIIWLVSWAVLAGLGIIFAVRRGNPKE